MAWMVDAFGPGGLAAGTSTVIGCLDIQSPRVQSATEMAALIRRAMVRVPSKHLWVNPFAGRNWAQRGTAAAHPAPG